MKLHIELVPRTAWGTSLSKQLKASDWGKIRHLALANQNSCCHTCGQVVKSLDAHEIWEFDEEHHIQKLVGIVGVCKPCHNTIHFGRAQKIGFGKEATTQFLTVNQCGLVDFQNECDEARIHFNRLNLIKTWALDISWIQESLNFPLKDLSLP